MPIIHEEIIEDIERQIRKCGGAWGEWCVGTAKDSRGPFFRQHLEADLGDGLTYREAYTTSAAQAVVAHLVNDRGLQLDHDEQAGSRQSAEGSKDYPNRDALPDPGKIVFVYRKTSPAPAASGADQATFHKLAA
jgi:hypothetical protein